MSKLASATWSTALDDGSQQKPRLAIEIGVWFDEGAPRSWQLTLSYSRYPEQHFSRTDLAPGAVALLQQQYPDGVSVSGSIGCHFVAGNGCFFETETPSLMYGISGNQQTLVGTVVFIPTVNSTPVIPLVPIPLVPVPGEGGEVPELAISPASTRHGELFPYVYMRTWPSPSPEALAEHFVRYPYGFDAPPTGQFLLSLAALRAGDAPDARQVMEALAVRYADGDGDPETPFVRDVTALPQPVCRYPEVYRLVRLDIEGDPRAVLEAVLELLGLTATELREYLASDAATLLRVRLFQSYFALVISYGYAQRLRALLAQCLIVDHLLWSWLELRASEMTRRSLRELAHATPVLPKAVFPLPPSKPEPGAASVAIVPYAIGDLHLVQQRLARYALGEIAYIESIMPGERRKSVRRQATRTSRAVTHAELREGGRETLEGSSSLRREVSKVLADTIATTSYPDSGFSIAYGPTTTLTGGWSQESKPSEGKDGPSRSTSLRDVRDVVERAAARAALRVVEARAECTSHESEHESVSVHDNRVGVCGRRGVYRWLNEVHVAEVVRYGNRFVLELMVPTPGKAYLRDAPMLPHASFPPIPPSALGLHTFEDIRPERFAELSARYSNAELEPPPAPGHSVAAFAQSGQPLTLPLPEGYEATSAVLGYVLEPGVSSLSVQGVLGATSFDISATETGVTRLDLKRDRSLLPVLLQAVAAAAGVAELAERKLALEIELVLSERRLDEWRARSFQAIQRAYRAERAAFGSARESNDHGYVEPRQDYGALQRAELKRGAFGLLGRRVDTLEGRSNADSASGTARPRYLQFLEHAFEWREFSYSLLAGPGGCSSRGVDGDAARGFAAFLEAEFAQLLLPVNPARALSVLYLLASGALWDEELDEVPVHESDLALACELKRLRGCSTERTVEGEPWEVIVPTALAVLADDCLELRG